MVLTRYIIREHLAPFIYGLALVVFIFVLNLVLQMLSRIAGKGIPWPVLLEFFLLNLAWILALAVPMAVLIATLAAYGRLAGDGEITALRASGVSPWRLMLPSLIFGAAAGLWTLWFNNAMLPEMNYRTKMLQIDISRKKPTLNIEPGVYTFDIDNYVLEADRVNQQTGELERVVIYDEHIPDQRTTITAQRGKLSFNELEETVELALNSGEIHRPSNRRPHGYEWTKFDSAMFRITVAGMVLRRGKEGFRGDREMTVKQMLEQVKELRRGPPGDYVDRRVASYMVEVHKKFSIPFACIIFVFIGAPLGMLAHRSGLGMAGGVSLLFFTIYWVFIVSGEKIADRGLASPALAMWSPNILFALLGVWLIWLARRRTTLPGEAAVTNLYNRIFRRRDGAKRGGGG